MKSFLSMCYDDRTNISQKLSTKKRVVQYLYKRRTSIDETKRISIQTALREV